MFHVEQLRVMDDFLKHKVASLPLLPGVYQFFDDAGKLLYVGKAKSLRKRVSSYFSKKHDRPKLRVLVSRIADVEHILVASEQDALLLENNLIKKHQPRYNAQMKDDKTYPWICVTNEPFPRIFMTRNRQMEEGTFYGPYSSVRLVRSLLELIFSMYKIRTCRHLLSEENVKKRKYKVCLEYHLERCLGGCEGLQSEVDYETSVSEVKKILSGSVSSLLVSLKEQMKIAAEKMLFEEAHLLKLRYDYLKYYQSKSVVASGVKGRLLVFSFVDGERFAYVNMLQVVEGAVVASRTLEVKKGIDEERDSLLVTAMFELAGGRFDSYLEVLVPFQLGVAFNEGVFRVPLKGDKYKLLQFSYKNAMESRRERQVLREKRNKGGRVKGLLEQVRKDLRLKVLPKHIECFDNSNIQGTNPVASCVVFRNGKPSKKEYRRFKIKTVVGADDFASMREIVGRRYKRLLASGEELPQLVLIDGGKGQLSAAVGALKEVGVYGDVAVVGIAKRLEELFFPEDTLPLYLDKRSETLRVLAHLRDEAHRFAVSFHRGLRSKNAVSSVLEEIEGVGAKTVSNLLKHFGSVAQIKNSSVADIAVVVGEKKAKRIKDYLS